VRPKPPNEVRLELGVLPLARLGRARAALVEAAPGVDEEREEPPQIERDR
jgi:hypothetical protein